MKKYILRDVKNVLTGKTRNDGRYPLRIGKTFIAIGFQPDMFGGRMGCFEYEDGHGTLRTSLVQKCVDSLTASNISVGVTC